MEKKKRNKRTINQNKGITLIALVITIIVLLILAGVSIAMLTGENGILTQANKSKVETRGAAVQEARDLWKANQELDEKTSDSTAQTLDELLSDLEKQNLLTSEEVATVKETGEITIGSRTIVFGVSGDTLVAMFEKAQEDGCTNEDESCQDETHLHIGDYVDYTEPEDGTVPLTRDDTGYEEVQTYSVDEATTWRVLGLSEDGKHVLITSGNPIKKSEEDPYFIMQGAEAYINCVDTLDKVCSIYKNEKYADEARSITVEDINRLGGIKVGTDKVYKESDPNTNIDELGVLGRNYTYESGDYAPENYMNDVYNKGLGNKKVGDTVPGTAYYYQYEHLGVNTRVYNMLFDETTSSDNYAKSYWLASPGALVVSSDAIFGPGAVGGGNVGSGYIGCFYSDGRWAASRLAVRPVVSLKSEVTNKEVSKSADQSEKDLDWTKYNNKNPNVDNGYIQDDTGLVDESTSGGLQ